MKIFITGGTGFIGSAVARRLLARGEAVTVLDNQSRRIHDLESLGAAAVIGDVRDAEHVRRVIAGADAVIHCAGLPKQASWRAYRGVHIDGTRNVLSAAADAGVRRVVHVSSHSAMFSGVDLPRMEESDPYPSRFIDPYSETKAAGERAALEFHGRNGMEVTVIRPDVVWGRGDTTILPIMAKLSRSPLGIPMCGDGSNIEATSHIENLVDGIILGLDSPASPGRVYLISDGFHVSWKEFLARQVEAAGVPAKFRRVPLWLAAPGAWILDKAAGAVGLPVPLARFGVWTSVTSRIVTSTRAADELGYRAKVGFEAGLADLAAWVQEIGGTEVLLSSGGKGAGVRTSRPMSQHAGDASTQRPWVSPGLADSRGA